MKKIIAVAVMLSTSLFAISVKAQTADEIVNKYITAIGGKDIIKQVNSIYMEGSISVMGNDAPTTVTVLNGKGYKSESDFNGTKSIQCFTEKGGWAVNPMAGGSAEPMPDQMYQSGKGQMNVGGALYDYAAKGSTVELQGKEGSNYKLKLVTKEKDETTYYIDAATYYISKVVKKGNYGGQEVQITVQFADYKKTDIGYIVPYTVNTDLGQLQLTATFTKATINKPVDAAIFAMPK